MKNHDPFPKPSSWWAGHQRPGSLGCPPCGHLGTLAPHLPGLLTSIHQPTQHCLQQRRYGFFWTWCYEGYRRLPSTTSPENCWAPGVKDTPGQPLFRPSSISSSSGGRSCSRPFRPSSWQMPAKACWLPPAWSFPPPAPFPQGVKQVFSCDPT